MSATLPKTNTITAAASDDEVMLDVFERLALAAGREVMRVYQAELIVSARPRRDPAGAGAA